MARFAFVLVLALSAGECQTPEEYFRGAGAGFRGTPDEQQLYWKPHIEASHRRILEAAEATARKEVAILLGPGVCSEIPLEELARKFDRVILADLDGHSALEAVESLPRGIRGKVELRMTDVTTFAAAHMETLRDAVESSNTAEEAYERLGAAFADMKTGVQRLWLPPADLVISSLLLSELPRYPLAYADRLLRTRFKTRLRDWEGYAAARAKLERLIVEDHAGVLASLCRPGGVVYFGDTVSRGPAYDRFGAGARVAVETAAASEFRRLGLKAEGGPEAAALIGRLCHAELGVEREIAAFEALLEAYEEAGDSHFESLVPMAELDRQWRKRRLSVISGAESWWWLEYPCAIVHSPGAFRVTSWILRSAASAVSGE